MEGKLKILAIVQARMGSSRLPGKVMKDINSTPVIGLLIKRLRLSEKLSEIIVATSSNKNNFPLIRYLESIDCKVFQGSEDDVLGRYFKAAKQFSADVIIRITGDCPLVDSKLLDKAIQEFIDCKCDYLSNNNPPSFPDGLDIEIFSFEKLQEAYETTTDLSDREHVTLSMKNNGKVKKFNIENNENLAHLRWTLDEAEDLNVIRKIFEYFHPKINFDWQEVLSLYKIQPDIFKENVKIKRNEGQTMKKGQKLWKRAKNIIPGGNMLLSKRPEMFLPDNWPSYFSKSKGCSVWDMDGEKYLDFSIMGVGTNILGYGHEEVDSAVNQVVNSGNMSTLNCPEEVYLAEKLIELNPWSDMVRFTRTGGEANAVAIRIARAASGKDNVAICGYHGWHDWYLAANIESSDKLDTHLLKGLEANGVPKNLKGTVFPFRYNNYEELEKIVNNEDIGTIKMEVIRSEPPKDDFLKKVRKLASKKGIVLIFDECTSGFRESLGGMHKNFSVEPDIAIFGKALGNGYSITAIVGKRNVMENTQNSFISSTFWTERIGPTAALKTLEVMERIKSWEKISNTGKFIKKEWNRIAATQEIDIIISGISALPSFTFNYKNHQSYKTLVTQEMLKKNFIASNAIYVCIDHSDDLIEGYISELEKVFKLIRECEDGRDISSLLEGPISHSGFERLN